MKTTTFAIASLLALLAGCSNDGAGKPSAGGAGTKAAVNRTLTAQAVRVHGDIVPTRLVAVDIPAPTDMDTIAGSDPAAPKKPFSVERLAEPSTRKDFYRLVTAENPAAAELPLDMPQTARIIVSARDRNASLRSVHVRHVETGQILDRSRDLDVAKPTVLRVPLDAKAVKGKAGQQLTAEPEPSAQDLANLAKQEPGFTSLTFPRRVLSIDAPATPGRVRLELPPDVLKSGVVVEVQQPDSPITLTAAPSELNYAFGDVAEVAFTLKNGEQPIDGATFAGELELPNGERVQGVNFEAKGNGNYLAHIPLVSADTKYIGVWHVHARADGKAGGVDFERTIEAGFGYAPAHARMNAVLDPVVLRGADGLVDEISFDVEVESAVQDRLGLNGTLVYTDGTGEHALAVAQTGQVVSPGKSTMTLHFFAKDLALAKVDGPFHLRELSLVSFAFATTQHRLGVAMDLVTPAIQAKEIRFPKELAPNVQDMVDLGLF